VRAIFVSYRRNDSEGEAGRIYDDLLEMFGDRSVFMDVAAITAGRDFRKAIDENVAQCGVLLALIGPGWLDAKNESGGRRLDEPGDFVRAEIASALKRDVSVIPVLVHGAKMPHADQLPDDLKDLAYRNCVELSHVRWKSDIKLLAKSLRSILGDPEDLVAGRAAGLRRGLEQSISWKPGVAPAGQPAATSHHPPGNGAVADSPIAASPAGCGALDPEAISRLTRELARFIGPIAEVVVKRAAKRCSTVPELRHIVAEEIDTAEDRTRFLDACSKN
jgi:hypothetical protein